MIVPVRCFSCGKVIGDIYEKYQQGLKEQKPGSQVLDELGVKRYCCRRMLVSHTDLIDQFLQYNI